MKCQFCGCMESKVVDSRSTDEGTSIRRRRECIQCGRRFTTYEKMEVLPMMVVKRDGRREPFSAEKVQMGIRHACEKLTVPTQTIEDIVRKVEQEAYHSGEREITTAKIGEMVMRELREVDDVAYVRFAAVYRKFTDVNTFMEEIQHLISEPRSRAEEAR